MRSRAWSSRRPSWTPRSCGRWPTPPGWPCWSTCATAGRPPRRSAPGSWACRPARPVITFAPWPGPGWWKPRPGGATAGNACGASPLGRYEVTGVADLAPEGREALRALMESLLAWDEVRVRRYLSQLDAEPPEWQDAAFFMDSTLQVTAEELTELSQAVYELLEPYRKDRRRGPAPRHPPGLRGHPRPPQLTRHVHPRTARRADVSRRNVRREHGHIAPAHASPRVRCHLFRVTRANGADGCRPGDRGGSACHGKVCRTM